MSDFPAGRLAEGSRVYAIGDVHGCADRLRALHAVITSDLTAHPMPDSTLVHLGDYVDRGRDSAGVLRLVARPDVPVDRVVNLSGNHEVMLLDALAHQSGAVDLWLDNGGDATLDSWGIRPGSAPDTWRAQVPAADLSFLKGLGSFYRRDGYLFVHAGIRPGVALDRQSVADMLWIREPFLSWRNPFGVMVVHGHTSGVVPVVRANRICVDTGAVMGGRLSCVVLQGGNVRFLQV